jgi:hypothetical protein
MHYWILWFAAACASFQGAQAFSALPSFSPNAMRINNNSNPLFSSASPKPPKRQPRRNLKKRPRKSRDGTGGSTWYNHNNNNKETTTMDDDRMFWETTEIRPLISRNAVELGEDYWIDPEDLKRDQERALQQQQRNSVGQISDEKLWTEVLSPYKQNWIGLISVTIVVLSFIIQTFPELTEFPVIPLPDL